MSAENRSSSARTVINRLDNPTLHHKVTVMQSNWAAEHLLVIRTLMERAAIYRRALAPIVLFLGVLGVAAAVLAPLLRITGGRFFVGYWSGVGVLGICVAYVMARRQA